MAPRTLATVDLVMDLVRVPVRIHSGTNESPGISFNLLHAKCKGKVRQLYVCPNPACVEKEDGPPPVLDRDAMMKGFEVAEGQYVTFTPEELEAIEEPPRAEGVRPEIVLDRWVPLEEVPLARWDKTYFLGPMAGGEPGYATFAETIRLRGRVPMTTWATRGRSTPVVIRAEKGSDGLWRLALHTLLRPDEVRSIADVPVPVDRVPEPRLKLALKLSEAHDAEVDEVVYRDVALERARALVAQKIAGKEIVAAPVNGKPQVIDLEEALRRSLLQAERKGPKRAEPERRGPKRAARS